MHAIISSIQRFSINDGPGIRTTVFMKGCPLRCMWCQNPESISPEPEVMCYADTTRRRLLTWISETPNLIQRLKAGEYVSPKALDPTAAAFLQSCYRGDVMFVGERKSIEDVMSEIERDRIFFCESGGGVTLSGGEPLAQRRFAPELLRRSKQAGIHTAVDTCGHVEWESIENVLPCTNLFLFDLKHIDPEKHRAYTGVSNDLILDNLRKLSTADVALTVSIPVIPRFNDDEPDAKRLGEFLAALGHRLSVRLLPYHHFSKSKYKALGISYPMPEISNREIRTSTESVSGILEGFGLRMEG